MPITHGLICFCILAFVSCCGRAHPTVDQPPELCKVFEDQEDFVKEIEGLCPLSQLPHQPLPSFIDHCDDELVSMVESFHVPEFEFFLCDREDPKIELWEDSLDDGAEIFFSFPDIPPQFSDDFPDMAPSFEHYCITTWSRTACHHSQCLDVHLSYYPTP